MKFLSSPYFGPLAWLFITIIGVQFFYWSPAQALLFYFFEYFIEWLIIGYFALFGKNANSDSKASFVMVSVFFLVFSFFCLFGAYWSNPFSGKFQDDIAYLFIYTFVDSTLLILLIIGVKVLNAYLKFKNQLTTDSGDLIDEKWKFKLLAAMPFVAILALIFNTSMFYNSFTTIILIAIFLTGFDMFWIYYQNYYLPNKNKLK